jgi:hypothetical protein
VPAREARGRPSARRLAVRSEPEVLVAEVLAPPRPPEYSVGSVAREAPVFPAAATKSERAAAPTGDNRLERIAQGRLHSDKDARRQTAKLR